MALLYSGLDDMQAAPVVAQLDANGTPYDIRNGSIWVAAAQRDRIRMELAAKNLPQMTGAGYEILDDMSGFSTTSQMFDAAYWRAKEGELARTILALPDIRSARVHLSVPQARGYRDRDAGAASVTVVTGGTALAPAQADAMRHLVASAVPRLDPGDVAVIDSRHGVIQPATDLGAQDHESRMRENVERILAAQVGPGNAVVELSVELVTESEQLVERQFDPAQRTLISEENEELIDESSQAGGAAVTAASNLPDRAQQDGDRQSAQRAETRSRANYEVGSVTRQVDRQPGAIRRLSVAVLLNGLARVDANGETEILPRSEQDMAGIEALVAAAVGFDPARGDRITVRSMPFASPDPVGTNAVGATPLTERLPLDWLARMALLGVLAIIALAVVLRRLGRTGGEGKSAAQPDLALPMAPGPVVADETASQQDTGSAAELPMISMTAAEFDFDNSSATTGDPVARLRALMQERQEETVLLLDGWIRNDERSRA
ncbi:flagellar M-ring protein FliF [Paracoccus isoporae]|uniref:Flagellar M-ring protein n=2 Tax=Paracoccus isoporae TaxID=591205 RepID=A0A1G6Z6E9_9RHOB|nr:flagellar M-ring protein FliF [Paracoccus isoporae]